MVDSDNLAQSIRESFLKELNELGLGSLFKVPFDYLVGKERFLGDYYAVWLSEIIGIDYQEIIVNLGVSYLFGRSFVIAQDQILDNPANFNQEYVLASPNLR